MLQIDTLCLGPIAVQCRELNGACEGILALKQAWPSAIRTVNNDHRRFEETYFFAFPVGHAVPTQMHPY